LNYCHSPLLPRKVRMACFGQDFYVPIHVPWFHCITSWYQFSVNLVSPFQFLIPTNFSEMQTWTTVSIILWHPWSGKPASGIYNSCFLSILSALYPFQNNLYLVYWLFQRFHWAVHVACIRQDFTNLRSFSLACLCTECIMFPCKLALLN